jgi:hypothetical protein
MLALAVDVLPPRTRSECPHSALLTRGVINDRAIHVNATSTRMCLFGTVWDV